jgi:YVTN family beta-propeller protein
MVRIAAAAFLVLTAVIAGAETPSPALLVLNKEGTLAIVDPATRKVVGRIATGESPHEVVVSTDGKFAFTSNYGSATPGHTISVIDLAARKEARRVDLGALRRPHGLDFAGGKLYFTAETNKLVGSYDDSSNQVDWLLGTGQNGTHMVLVSKDTNQVYTSNIGSDTICILERAGVGNWNSTVLAVGKGPEGFDLTPDGRQLWVAHSRDGGVSIVDLATQKVVQTFGVQTRRSNRLKITSDGRLVLISDLEGGELVILERETKKELKRLKLGRNPAGILVQPDSSRAYVAVTGDNDVAVVDLKSLALAARIQTGAGPDGMAWVGK